MWKLLLGLLCLMGANIALGSSLAKLKAEFNKDNLINGGVKAGMIILALILIYLCGILNPDMIIGSINQENITLMKGLEYLYTAGIVMYGTMVLGKLGKIIGVSTSIENATNEEIIEIKRDDI